MSLLQRMSRVAAVTAGPLIFAQARRLRRETPRLPEAAKPWSGSIAGPNPMTLLVIGDSTAVGVGAATIDEALPGNVARELNAHWKRGVDWTTVGENGATTRDLLERFIDEATTVSYDFIFLTIGANDALQIRSRAAFGRDLKQLLKRLHAASPTAKLLMSSLPAFYRFELLPNPLRSSLYLHSQSLEAEARSVVEAAGDIMSPPPPPYTEGFFASDLFHPSAKGYHDWAKFAIGDAFERGQLR